MRALALTRPGPVETSPLRVLDRTDPVPRHGEVLVRVEACGVCRTDLHVVEGDLPVHREHVIPGHEVVGRVVRAGAGVTEPALGSRVGVAWLHRACGRCRFCARGAENLCTDPTFTGWDVDGGYAELVVAPAAFVHPLPDDCDAVAVAPLLCAGIIGYRAYERSRIQPGGRLGIYGFGGSAHIVLQIARHRGCRVFVFTRGGTHREHATALGADWVGDSFTEPPEPLDAAILFAPAGELVRPALEALDRGGTLAIAGIHLSDVPSLDYERHLFQERAVQSVTANTREDARTLLALAFAAPIRTDVTSYPLASANEALQDLKQDRVRGAAVLVP